MKVHHVQTGVKSVIDGLQNVCQKKRQAEVTIRVLRISYSVSPACTAEIRINSNPPPPSPWPHMPHVWNAKLTYIQIFVPIFKYLNLGTNHLYLGTNHLYLGTNQLYLGSNDLKIGINDLYLGTNDLYLSSNTAIYTYL